jgi:D-xylose reductase
MEELVHEGLVRNIGISNCNILFIREILKYAKIRPAVLQVELHPFSTQERLLHFCRLEGIAVTAYSSFGGVGYVSIGLS